MTSVVSIKEHDEYEGHRRSVAAAIWKAKRLKPKQIVIVGIDENGHFFVAGHPNNISEMLFLMEMGKRKLFGDIE
jgi:hypothetical protein